MKISFRIHPLTYIILLIAFLTGYFKDAIFLTSVIIIHEFGHILMALLLKWKISKIIFFPFGGLTIFNELINKPLIEEFLIVLMGPIFQIIYTLIINNVDITFYSKFLLLINLIPIYPLDGSKIINIFLNKIFSFKKSHILTIYISFFISVFLMFLSIIYKELIYILFLILLIIKLKEELNNHELLFNKFLYERYIYDFHFKKVKIVKNLEKFKKDFYHYLKKDKNLIEEKEVLKNKYEKKLFIQ